VKACDALPSTTRRTATPTPMAGPASEDKDKDTRGRERIAEGEKKLKRNDIYSGAKEAGERGSGCR
jgi:hypothetical protein